MNNFYCISKGSTIVPSPCLLISVMSTSYSLPTSIGCGVGESVMAAANR